MCGTNVLDKDGVSGAMVCSEMATYLYKHEKTTLYDQLQNIYNKWVLLVCSEMTTLHYKHEKTTLYDQL